MYQRVYKKRKVMILTECASLAEIVASLGQDAAQGSGQIWYRLPNYPNTLGAQSCHS